MVGDLPFFVSPGFKRCVGQSGVVSTGRAAPATFCRRCTSRLLQSAGTALGQSCLQLGGSPAVWLSLVDKPFAFTLEARRRDPARSLPRLRGGLAYSGRSTGAHSQDIGCQGPGDALFSAVERELGNLPFIAEDLGTITPEVNAMRDQFQLPGMRVLQFAFDGRSDNPHLPENYVSNAVAYTGTHDNPTTRAWSEDLTCDQREKIRNYLRGRGAKSDEVARALIELAWSSVAALAMAPLQDLLNLGREARMNVPGRPDGNWLWRTSDDMLSDRSFEWLCDLTRNANRSRVLVKQNAR